MKNTIIKAIYQIRARLMRWLKPKKSYFLAAKNTKPLSRKFGFDRGTPIDRFWIESFLKENENHIKGVCLEIGDSRYTREFGAKIVRSDILDINKNNKMANLYGDLRNLRNLIADNTYDCLILTHVLGMIDNYEAAIAECKRIIKPGGILLVTTACISPVHEIDYNYFRFTVASARYVFGKYFRKNNLEVKSFGNVLTGQCFWVGIAREELTPKELEYNDPHYPCIITVRAKK